MCNLVAHQIAGTPISDAGLPSILVVDRRFNFMHLDNYLLPNASVLYFEYEKESDRVVDLRNSFTILETGAVQVWHKNINDGSSLFRRVISPAIDSITMTPW